MDWVKVRGFSMGNSVFTEFNRAFNGGILVVVVTETEVDDRVSSTIVWVPDAADKTSAV